jgi:hypothetical protein
VPLVPTTEPLTPAVVPLSPLPLKVAVPLPPAPFGPAAPPAPSVLPKKPLSPENLTVPTEEAADPPSTCVVVLPAFPPLAPTHDVGPAAAQLAMLAALKKLSPPALQPLAFHKVSRRTCVPSPANAERLSDC